MADEGAKTLLTDATTGIYVLTGENVGLRPTRYECPKHGPAGDDWNPEFLELRVKRELLGQWCIRCWAEELDKAGVCRVVAK